MLRIEGLKAVDYTTLNFNHGATMSYGKRIGFVNEENKALLKTNPRGEFGKFGISCHSYLGSFFHSTITAEVEEAKTLEKKVVYLNKKSTVKWLNSQLPQDQQVNDNMPAKEIVDKINGLSAVLKQAESVKEDEAKKADKPTYTASLNTQNLHSFIDRIKAVFWRAFASLTNSTWRLLRLRFALQLREKTIDQASKILATDTYRTTVDTVPAYKKFVQPVEESKQEYHRFDELPVTSKDNYIKPALKKEEETSLYVNGQIPLKSKRDTSTGTSGPSTPWYRGVEEQMHVEKMTTYAAKAILGDRPYSFINGFAMGPWATGVTATLAMNQNPQAGIAVIGPNIDEIYACIKEQARIYGKNHPIVVSGYPPHIRAVVEKAVKEGFPLHDYTIIGVVGGEAMSEDLRDLLVEQKEDEKGEIKRTGFKQCYSSYGASDLDINIGYESDFEIELRKLCHKPENAALAEELFGKNEFKPMIFHYDPLNYHIESDEHRNLYYTCVRGDRISPRVRYNLGDIGKTMPVSDLLATLKKHGIELKNPPNTSLPLLFVWGRQGAQISFRGCKVAPENLGEAIRRLDATDKPGINEQIAHYGFYQYESKGRTVTEVFLEFNEDKDYDKADPELLEKLIDKLAQVNTDFVAQINACPKEEKPVLRVFKKGESPMDIQQKRYPMRKKQYIFKSGDEFIPAHADIASKGKLVQLA
jgi:phenylacetate-coenzyme A ligase PaaK-like adenylate-forming protein